MAVSFPEKAKHFACKVGPEAGEPLGARIRAASDPGAEGLPGTSERAGRSCYASSGTLSQEGRDGARGGPHLRGEQLEPRANAVGGPADRAGAGHAAVAVEDRRRDSRRAQRQFVEVHADPGLTYLLERGA